MNNQPKSRLQFRSKKGKDYLETVRKKAELRALIAEARARGYTLDEAKAMINGVTGGRHA